MLDQLHEDIHQTRSIENLLDGLASLQSSSQRRVELLAQLERLFGLAVLGNSSGGGVGNADSSESSSNAKRSRQSDWWDAQSRPRSCVALSLVSLLHRLHLVATLSPYPNGAALSDPSDEMTSCFTILQGLCLKDVESGQICSSRSTLELILAILDASYWQQLSTAHNYALAHGIDLLICATMASRSASALFDSLKGEDVIRALMERHIVAGGGSIDAMANGRRTITLNAVQGSPIAIKCAEFLLLFASERAEPPPEPSALQEHVAGQTSIIADSSMILGLPRVGGSSGGELRKRRKSVVDQPTRLLESPLTPKAAVAASPTKGSAALQRSRRARSVSPTKLQDKRARSRFDALNDVIDRQEHGTTSVPRQRRSVPATIAARSSSSLGETRPPSAERRDNDVERATPRPLHRSPIKSYPPPKMAVETTASASSSQSSPTKAAALYRARFPSTPFAQPALGRAKASKRGMTMSDAPSTNSDSAPVAIREPLGAIQSVAEKADDAGTPPFASLSGSPSKMATIGPSPAVRRAHARSISPQKRPPSHSPRI